MLVSASNTSCSFHSRSIRRHDLAQEYAVEPFNYSAIMDRDEGGLNAHCVVYWRDPMQVCNAT